MINNTNTFKKYTDKKLLIITPSYPNKNNTFIVELFVKNQLEQFKKYFKEITVIAPVLFSFKILSKDKLCKNYSYDNIKVYFPRCFYIPIFCYDNIKVPRCFYIPIFYFSKILMIDNRLRVVENLIKKEDIEFDLIHAHFTWPSAYIGVKLKEKINKSVIVTIHEESGCFDEEIEMNHPLINYAWKNADALIRVNKKDVPILKRFNKNVYSIPNGFSPRFKTLNKNGCRSKLHLPIDKKIIFTLGWLIERKGFNYLIDAIKIITEKRKDVLCFIGGSGPLKGSSSLKNKLQKQINNLDLQDHIKLLGFIPNDLLSIWMNACDVFVLPSLAEGNPTVMFECLGCGKPFVGTKVGGEPEIITSEDYGLLCEPANPEELAEKIFIALDKKWDREKIRKYAERFTWENIAEEIMAVYTKAEAHAYKTEPGV